MTSIISENQFARLSEEYATGVVAKCPADALPRMLLRLQGEELKVEKRPNFFVRLWRVLTFKSKQYTFLPCARQMNTIIQAILKKDQIGTSEELSHMTMFAFSCLQAVRAYKRHVKIGKEPIDIQFLELNLERLSRRLVTGLSPQILPIEAQGLFAIYAKKVALQTENRLVHSDISRHVSEVRRLCTFMQLSQSATVNDDISLEAGIAQLKSIMPVHQHPEQMALIQRIQDFQQGLFSVDGIATEQALEIFIRTMHAELSQQIAQTLRQIHQEENTLVHKAVDTRVALASLDEKRASVNEVFSATIKRIERDLIVTGLSQKACINLSSKRPCIIKARYVGGDIRIETSHPLGAGGSKQVYQIKHLAGPALSHQPGPVYAYAKVTQRKALKIKLAMVTEEINRASYDGRGILSLLQQKETLSAQLETLQREIVREAEISFEVPSAVRMWVVHSEKSEEQVKGVLMELCDGGQLRDFFIRQKFPLSNSDFTQALLLGQRLCVAVGQMHEARICHLDLKAENILLKRQGEDLIPKIIDFGLARKSGDALAGHHGLPWYMPPEQQHSAQPLAASPSMDAWALGIHLLTLFYGWRQLLAFRKLCCPPYVMVPRGKGVSFYPWRPNEESSRRMRDAMHRAFGARHADVDEVIWHLMDPHPETRWTAQQAADRLTEILSK